MPFGDDPATMMFEWGGTDLEQWQRLSLLEKYRSTLERNGRTYQQLGDELVMTWGGRQPLQMVISIVNGRANGKPIDRAVLIASLSERALIAPDKYWEALRLLASLQTGWWCGKWLVGGPDREVKYVLEFPVSPGVDEVTVLSSWADVQLAFQEGLEILACFISGSNTVEECSRAIANDASSSGRRFF